MNKKKIAQRKRRRQRLAAYTDGYIEGREKGYREINKRAGQMVHDAFGYRTYGDREVAILQAQTENQKATIRRLEDELLQAEYLLAARRS